MLFKALITILICDAVFAIIAIPLMLRKVPRNVVYGFRIKATLEMTLSGLKPMPISEGSY